MRALRLFFRLMASAPERGCRRHVVAPRFSQYDTGARASCRRAVGHAVMCSVPQDAEDVYMLPRHVYAQLLF